MTRQESDISLVNDDEDVMALLVDSRLGIAESLFQQAAYRSAIQLTATLPYKSLPLSHTNHCTPPMQIAAAGCGGPYESLPGALPYNSLPSCRTTSLPLSLTNTDPCRIVQRRGGRL